MKRPEIYKKIDKERDYQDSKWGGPSHDAYKSVGDFLVYMQYYVSMAKKAYTVESGNQPALDQMRKVVALGLACFEIHGCPDREDAS